MYVRPDGHRGMQRELSVPKNYSGNAFSESSSFRAPEKDEGDLTVESSVDEEVTVSEPSEVKKGIFTGLADNDDLLLLGLILLLSRDGLGDDIVPLLLMLLLFKK